jgi:hypothetical protein
VQTDQCACCRLCFKPTASEGETGIRGASEYLPDCVSFLKTYKKTIVATGSIRVPTLPVKLRKNVLCLLRKKMRQIAVFLLVFADRHGAKIAMPRPLSAQAVASLPGTP